MLLGGVCLFVLSFFVLSPVPHPSWLVLLRPVDVVASSRVLTTFFLVFVYRCSDLCAVAWVSGENQKRYPIISDINF